MKSAIRLCFIVAIAALFSATGTAYADFELTISEGSTVFYDSGVISGGPNHTVSVVDTDLSAHSGFVISNLVVGSSFSSPTSANVTITSLDVTANATVTGLTISIAQSDITKPNGPSLYAQANLTNLTAVPGGPGNDATYTGYVDTGNGSMFSGGVFSGSGTSLGPVQLTGLNGTPSSTSSAPGYFVPTGQYSLGGQLVLNLTNGTDFVGQAGTVAQAPEPGTIAILASGLPLLGLCKLRRRRKTTSVVA